MSEISNFSQGEDFFKRLIDSLEDYAVFIIDTKGTIKSWNGGAEKILGYKEEEIIGKNYSVFFTKEDIKNKIPLHERQVVLKEERSLNEGWRIKKSGEKFWATGFLFPFRNSEGNMVGFTKIMRDRTERKLFENQKDEFIGIASHELRTPVTSLKLFSDILLTQTQGIEKKSIAESVSIIKSQTDKLMRLVNDLLDVSKIQGGRLELNKSNFDVHDLLESTIHELRHIHTSHTIVYKQKVTKKVHADKERITQVLINLISNAVKYSPRAKKIVITVKEKEDSISIHVQDFGLGIPKREQTKIFERFFRTTDAKDKNISGFGLGLYISSEIVARHGGKLTVKSVPRKGSIFSFSLPSTP